MSNRVPCQRCGGQGVFRARGGAITGTCPLPPYGCGGSGEVDADTHAAVPTMPLPYPRPAPPQRTSETVDRRTVVCDAEPFAWVAVGDAPGIPKLRTHEGVARAEADALIAAGYSTTVVPLHRPIDTAVASAIRAHVEGPVEGMSGADHAGCWRTGTALLKRAEQAEVDLRAANARIATLEDDLSRAASWLVGNTHKAAGREAANHIRDALATNDKP
jgi:hypothetical protein